MAEGRGEAGLGDGSGLGWCVLRVKAVPGSSRDVIAGVLGDRLKVRVSAAPEAGKANAAIAELLAAELGVRASAIRLTSGATNANKAFRVGVAASAMPAAWAGCVTTEPG